MSNDKKLLKTIKINCETVQAAETMFNVLQGAASDICKEVKRGLAVSGNGNSDPSFEDHDFDKLSFSLKVKPEDKGDVIVMGEDGLATLTSYKDVADEEIYVIIESGVTIMYQRLKEEGSFDRPIGKIINTAHMTDAFKVIPSDLAAEKEAKIAQQKTKEETKASDEELVSIGGEIPEN